jgi:hypothetical protein
MCDSSNVEYQYINPSTQIALFSYCIDNCPSIVNITWIIYQGLMNSSSRIIQWIPFKSPNLLENHFLGLNTKNLTVMKDIFNENEDIIYWKFQVIYSVQSEIGLSALYFQVNQRPKNGSCQIDPLNGTIDTLFTINCSNWLDIDQIKDYSFYG